MEKIAKGIEEISYLSKEDFSNKYFEKNKPVILKGLARNTMAFKTWTPEYLKELIGPRLIKLCYSRSGVFNFHKGEATVIDMPFDEAVDYMKKNNSYYISQASLVDNFPELIPQIDDPLLIEDTDIRGATNLWFGGAGCWSPLHYDTSHNFLVQVYGRKEVTLYPPSDKQFLYPTNERGFYHVSHVDINDTERYPLFKYSHPSKFILEPGDILYIPLFWWHYIGSLDVSISVNFWWDRFALVEGIGFESEPIAHIEKAIRMFIDNGLSIDHTNIEGETMLLQACYKGYYNVVKVLLQLGANVHAISKKYEPLTAIDLASKNGFRKIVQLLNEFSPSL